MPSLIVKSASRGLCHSCSHSQVMVDRRGEEVVLCNEPAPNVLRIRTPLVSCSQYARMGQMSDWEARKIGWVLEQKGKQIGFRPPKAEE